MINEKNVKPGEGCSWHEVTAEGDKVVRRVVVRDPDNGEYACLMANEKNGKGIQRFRLVPAPNNDFIVRAAKGTGQPDERMLAMARELRAEWEG